MEQVMIKIISGVYGYDTGTTVIGKSVTDEPFLLEKEKAQRIIDLGVAIEVETERPLPPNTQPKDEPPKQEVDEQQAKDGKINQEEHTETLLQEVDLASMTLQQLREFAEHFGVKYKVGCKKEDFIVEINAAMTAIQAEGDDTLPSFDDEAGVQQS